MHVLEPPDLWQRYIDPAWKHAAPVGLTELRRDMRVKLKSSVVLRIGTVRPQRGDAAGPWSTAQDEAFAEAERRGWDALSQLQAMDREGLDVAVLFPSRGLFVLGLDVPQVTGIDGLEPDFAAAIARAYNDWLRDFCAHAPERMLGAGMVAPHDVAAAVAETRRCVEQLGFKAIFLAPGCVARRPWHDPYYDPLWAECERLGIPVTFHGGGQTYLKPDFSLEVLDKLVMWHTFGQPLGVMFVAVSLCAGGVLERFPRLRVGLLEGNCGWATWLFHRLDEHWERAGRRAFAGPQAPRGDGRWVPRRDRAPRPGALQGWPSQRNAVRCRDDGGRDRLGNRDVESDVEIPATWAKAVSVDVLYGPAQVSLAPRTYGSASSEAPLHRHEHLARLLSGSKSNRPRSPQPCGICFGKDHRHVSTGERVQEESSNRHP